MRASLVAAAAVFLLTTVLAQEPSVKGSVEGVVRNAKNDDPIVGARVTLASGSAPAANRGGVPTVLPIPPVTTDGQGRFAFKDVDPGDYRMTIQSNGYALQEYGQKVFPGQGTPIHVIARQPTNGLVVRLTPTGTLTGRIRDTNGLPAADAPVQLAKFAYDANGQRSLSAVSFTRTDDRGDYRFHFVTPGRYFVGAGNLPGAPQAGAGVLNTTGTPNGGQQVYSFVFFPGVAEVEQARIVDVPSGGELNGIDIKVDRRRQYAIRGRVVDAKTGQPPANVSVSLNFPPGAATGMASSGTSYDAATGNFEWGRVVPGLYGVVATVRPPLGQPGGTAGPAAGPSFVAYTVIRIVDSDIDNLLLTIDSFSMNGKYNLEGGAVLPDASLRALRTELHPFRNDSTSTVTTARAYSRPVNPDGSFAIDGVLKGTHRLVVGSGLPLPPGFYVKAARLGAADVLNGPMLLDGPVSAVLEILLSSKAGQVEGMVSDERGRAVEINQVVLIPDQHRERTELFKLVTSDSTGRFTISNVAPGEYKIFAWEALEAYSYYDPEVLKRYESLGKAIRVEESSKQKVDLRIIPAAVP